MQRLQISLDYHENTQHPARSWRLGGPHPFPLPLAGEGEREGVRAQRRKACPETKSKGTPRGKAREQVSPWRKRHRDSSAAALNRTRPVGFSLEEASTSAIFAFPTCFMPRSCAAFMRTPAFAAFVSRKPSG